MATDDDLPALPPVQPGRYRHYKGGEYRLLGAARHSETLEALALYQPLYGRGELWVRPLAMFQESVQIDGRLQPRFARLAPPADAAAPAEARSAPPKPDIAELAATVARMEAALIGTAEAPGRAPAECRQRWPALKARFEHDLAADPRDALLAMASALMGVQVLAAEPAGDQRSA